MPRRLPFGLIAVLAVAPAGICFQKVKDRPRWFDDVAAARAEAQRTRKPIFAVLH